MNIQYLNINEYKYRINYIPYEECNSNEQTRKSFVMLRDFSIINNIVTDKNIYFIETSIFESYKENCLKEGKENEYLIFPSNKDIMYYSSEYHIFNDTYIDSDLINKTGIYDILEKKQLTDEDGNIIYDENNNVIYTFEPNQINCDLIKIYHPSTKSKENLIIHIENVINNIHFHYLCTKYQWYYNPENNKINKQYNSDNEYRFENNIYSEYIKCYIPCIRELFDRIILDKDVYDYKWYFRENLNIVDTISEKNSNFLKNTIIKTTEDGYLTDNEDEIYNQYVPITLFTQPCSIEEYTEDKNQDGKINKDEKIFKKVYFKYNFSLDNNYLTTPINVSLYPFTSLNETTKIFTLSDDFLPGTLSFINDYSFSLSANIDFNANGNISLISYFNYPFKEIFEANYPETSLSEAYCFFNHIVDRNGTYLTELKNIYFEELDEINCITDIDDETIQFLIDSKLADRNPMLTPDYPTKKSYYIAKLKESHWQVFLEEYVDEFKAKIDFFGFRIEIASDKKFKNIIFEKNISLLNNVNINDVFSTLMNTEYLNIFQCLKNGLFFFPLNGLFTDWKQMPQMVVARIYFIDRFIGNEIKSNDIFISKDKFKYITNMDLYRLDQLVDINKKYNNDKLLNNKDNIKDMIELNLDNGEQQIKGLIDEFNDTINNIPRTLSSSKVTELKETLDNYYQSLNNWYNEYVVNNTKGLLNYNFINKINCKVKNNEEETKDLNYKNNNQINIIYKPIFFKTNKLNNLMIKYMQNQNVGIDLHEYMSKVNLFIMTLDGNTYYEIGRNSNYVLFNINSSVIKNETGTFEIYNDDHEYITYGTWSLYR